VLTVADEAQDHLFVLLDCTCEHIPEGTCVRLIHAEADEAVLQLSRESDDDDDCSEFEGRTVDIEDRGTGKKGLIIFWSTDARFLTQGMHDVHDQRQVPTIGSVE
jgi:hypothetical protein